jgi:heme-degrading monooxygenase HmoA
VIERHVTFHLHPGKAGDFGSCFRSDYGPALARQAGFLGAELLRPQEGEDTLMLVLRFKDAEAAQAWRESADHKALSPRLKSLYQSSEVHVLQVLAQQPAPG